MNKSSSSEIIFAAVMTKRNQQNMENLPSKDCSDVAVQFGFRADFSWGVGSLRQCAGFPGSLLNPEDSVSYVSPLGALIVCWDISSKRRKLSFQAHSDLITVMLFNYHYTAVLTASYSGEIKLWDRKWKVLVDEKAKLREIHFADWSANGNRFLLCGGNDHESVLIVYQVESGREWSISDKWSACPPKYENNPINENQEFSTNGTEGINSEVNPGSPTYVEQKDYYDMAMFASDEKVIALLQRHHNNFSEAHLYTEDGEFLKCQVLDPLGDPKASLMCLSPCHNGTFAVGFQGGIFLLLDERQLSVNAILQATGSPQVAIWHGDYLLAMSYLSGILSWWTAKGELVHELQGGSTNSIVHLNWEVPGKALWVGGIMSLHFVSLHYSDSNKTFPDRVEECYRLKYLEVTGCGVSVNNSNLVAAGDFTGNILVWEKGQTEPPFRTKYEGAVRSLTWNNAFIFIGCLDGTLLRWQPGCNSCPIITLACIGGILTMAWSLDYMCLALGLDTGHLCLYKFKHNDTFEPVELLNFRAHCIKQEDQDVAAEIWSVCWSPCGNMIATASEDQTTSVWNWNNG